MVSNLPQKVGKSQEKVEKRVGKSVKKKSLEKMRTRKKKGRTRIKLQRRFKIESVIHWHVMGSVFCDTFRWSFAHFHPFSCMVLVDKLFD